MTVNLTIQADIIDIKSDTPKPGDIFFVDTNVWIWQTYSNASLRAKPYQIQNYPNYLAKALSVGATLTYSGLTLAEITHTIENSEYKIFKKSHSSVYLKEYRHNYSLERTNVVSEIQSAWSQVSAIAIPVDLAINDEITNAALTRLQTQAVDGYDLLLLETISRAGAEQVRIITDDKDYAVVPNIQVFTSGNSLIQQAQAQGKLLLR
jgi:predicted nucleic acid-binding protein